MINEIPGATEFPSCLPEQISQNFETIRDAGYDVREYTISAPARVFADSNGAHPHLVTATSEFTSRVVSVFPLSPEKFSGNVHFELLNPSGGMESSMFWPDAAGYILQRGDAYVGLTCKNVIVEALKARSSTRYAHLSVGHDGLLWDMVAAVARALRTSEGGGMLPALKPAERIIANGWSQSGSFLRTYLSEHLHELHSLEAGHDIIDGYVIGVSSGGFGPMGYVNIDRDGELDFDEDLRPLGDFDQLQLDDPRRVVRGASVPVMEFMTEDEVMQHQWHSRGDSDTPGDLYRCYQIPGRGHISGVRRVWYEKPVDGRQVPEGDLADGPEHVATIFLLAAALDNLILWTRGVKPPRADPIVVDIPASYVRDMAGVDYRALRSAKDSSGHAKGGVRYLDVDVPHTSMAADVDGPLTMKFWEHRAFSADQMRGLYGSVEVYRERVERRLAELVEARWYLPEHVPTALHHALDGIEF
jgi:hypothetical protein